MRYFLLYFFIFCTGIVQADPYYEIFIHNGKQGLKDNSGQIVIPPHFDELGWSFLPQKVKNGRIGFMKNGKWGIVSVDNKILYRAELEAVYDATPSIIIVGEKQVNGRYKRGVIDYSGKTLIPFKYNFIKAFDTQLLALEGNQYGLLDFDGKVIVPFQYQNISRVGEFRWFMTNNDGKGALTDNEGSPLTEFILDDLKPLVKDHYLATVNHSKGLLDNGGEWVLDPGYRDIIIEGDNAIATTFITFTRFSGSSIEWQADSIQVLSDNIFQHYASGSTWLTDENDNEFFPTAKSIEYIEGRLLVSTDHGVGLYDPRSNEWIFNPVSHDAVSRENNFLMKETMGWSLYNINTRQKTLSRIQQYHFEEEGVYIKKNDSWGFIDTYGKQILPSVFSEIKNYSDGYFHVVFHGEEGIIDKGQNWVAGPADQHIISFNSSAYITRTGELNNLYNYSGQRLYFTPNPLSLKEDYVLETIESDGIVKHINFQGITFLSDYREIFPVSEDYIGILKNGKYGFVDTQGRLLIANRYDAIQPFSYGHASVQLLGKWGVINKQEQLVIQPKYDSVGFFVEKNAIVTIDGKMGVINLQGDEILSITFDEITRLTSVEGNYFILDQNGKKGIADSKGKIIIWPKYDSIQFSDGFLIVTTNKKEGLHTISGISILPPIYEKVITIPDTKNFLLGNRQEKVVVKLN